MAERGAAAKAVAGCSCCLLLLAAALLSHRAQSGVARQALSGPEKTADGPAADEGFEEEGAAAISGAGAGAGCVAGCCCGAAPWPRLLLNMLFVVNRKGGVDLLSSRTGIR